MFQSVYNQYNYTLNIHKGTTLNAGADAILLQTKLTDHKVPGRRANCFRKKHKIIYIFH